MGKHRRRRSSGTKTQLRQNNQNSIKKKKKHYSSSYTPDELAAIMACFSGYSQTNANDIPDMAREMHGGIYYCIGDARKQRSTPG